MSALEWIGWFAGLLVGAGIAATASAILGLGDDASFILGLLCGCVFSAVGLFVGGELQ